MATILYGGNGSRNRFARKIGLEIIIKKIQENNQIRIFIFFACVLQLEGMKICISNKSLKLNDHKRYLSQ